MRAERTPIAALRDHGWRWLEFALAVLLTAGALVEARALSEHSLSPLAIVSSVAVTGSVAWSRRIPAPATLVAATGLVTLVLADPDAGYGVLADAAIIWSFYWLGRRGPDPDHRLVCAAVLTYWLLACAAIGYATPSGPDTSASGPLPNALFWVLSGILPFSVGFVLAARSATMRQLEEAAAQLEDEHALSSDIAAAAERAKMARELHDAVAHCMSVMVVQTSGARRVASSDLGAARDALWAVEHAGREALVELRRIVGVLYRSDDDVGSGTPGLAHLDALADRARAAGLPVELQMDGRRPLSLGLELAIYRVVQEALTNAIKHAGPAEARVLLTFGPRELELRVCDSGRGPASGNRDGSGHGLVGMSERVRLYGGELHAGARSPGGFEVRARIPLDAGEPTPQRSPVTSGREPRTRTPASDQPPMPWLDPLLAIAFLATLEIGALVSSTHGAVLFRDMVVLAAMALAAVWRRRRPLWFVLVVVALTFALSSQVAPRNSLVTAMYVGVIPAYAVAAWEDRRNAVLGLAILATSSAVGQVLLHHVSIGNYAGALFIISIAWAAGRAVRARRLAAAALELRNAQLAADRNARVELAVAGERSRIARELHAIVAHSVAAMVIQAEAARSMLGQDLVEADQALDAIQGTGRQALSEMRRILGVLRHQGDHSELVPRPGVDRMYDLVQRARERGLRVELNVEGEPGALSAGVDLGIYRILEEALDSMDRQPASAVAVALRFGGDDVELQLVARCPAALSWPTGAMRERVALCGGELVTGPKDGTDAWDLRARIPRGLQGASP